MHLLMYLLQQTIVEIGHFLTREGRETKLCLLSTQEKLMNSCKSTPKSEYWVWLSMVQKMSGILIESRLSHVFMLTAFIIATARAKLMLPCCLMKYISLCNRIYKYPNLLISSAFENTVKEKLVKVIDVQSKA